MSLDLASVKAKLRRSKEHANALKEDVSEWFHPDPYKLIQEFNRDFTEVSLILQRIAPTLPRLELWSLQFGDAIHNLRSVLDHLVYAIALDKAGSSPFPGERSLAFIIEGCHEDFAAKRSRMKPNALNSAMWAAMESVQPYNRPHQTLPPLLKILADLDNSDKHRLPHAFLATFAEIGTSVVGNMPLGVTIKQVPRPFLGELQERTEVLRTTFTGPAPDMHYEVSHVDMIFAVWHGKRHSTDPEWMGRTEAASLLTAITEDVEKIMEIMVGVAA